MDVPWPSNSKTAGGIDTLSGTFRTSQTGGCGLLCGTRTANTHPAALHCPHRLGDGPRFHRFQIYTSCAARQYGQAASTSVTHQWRRFVAPVWRSARRTYEGVQQFIDNARMSDRATVRGERGSCTPPEFIPGRVVSRFPEANWIPLSYRHPLRCWRIETAGSPPTSVYLKVSAVRVAAGVADECQRLLWQPASSRFRR